MRFSYVTVIQLSILMVPGVFVLEACEAVNDVANEHIGMTTDASDTGTQPDGTPSSSKTADDSDTSQNVAADLTTTRSGATDSEDVLSAQPVCARVADGCMAPDREDYMAQFGVTRDDDDLSDSNVVEAKRHTILFVFDKSGSMAKGWNTDGGTKWEIAREAMLDAVAPFGAYVTAGALFFPLEGNEEVTASGALDVAMIDSGIQIEFSAAADFLKKWESNMGDYAAGGSTPLMDALEMAEDAIECACGSGLMTRPFKVVLITDGMPDYWDSQRGLSLIKHWHDMGIETTVIGMPGSGDASNLLADIADVGSGGTIDLSTGTVTGDGDAVEIIYDSGSSSTELEHDLVMAVE
jgi:Mg-chelatase subunit ChlD